MTIERINPGPRSSEMVVHNDTIYVTTTPNTPSGKPTLPRLRLRGGDGQTGSQGRNDHGGREVAKIAMDTMGARMVICIRIQS